MVKTINDKHGLNCSKQVKRRIRTDKVADIFEKNRSKQIKTIND